MKGIEKMVDRLLSDHKLVKPKKPRIKKLWKLSPGGLLWVFAIVGSAMLIGSLFSFFIVNHDGIISITGTMKPIFEYDGVPFETQWYNTSCDFTDITSGENLSATHSIKNADLGCWLVSWDLREFYRDDFDLYPLHEFYGLNLTVGGLDIMGVPITDPADFKLLPGETGNFTFYLFCHPEMVTPPDDYHFNMNISITRANEPPDVEDDYIHVDYSEGGAASLDVTLNDYDFENDPLTIDSITPMQYAGFVGLTIQPDNKTVVATILGTGLLPGDRTFTVTITDGQGNYVNSILTVHATL